MTDLLALARKVDSTASFDDRLAAAEQMRPLFGAQYEEFDRAYEALVTAEPAYKDPAETTLRALGLLNDGEREEDAPRASAVRGGMATMRRLVARMFRRGDNDDEPAEQLETSEKPSAVDSQLADLYACGASPPSEDGDAPTPTELSPQSSAVRVISMIEALIEDETGCVPVCVMVAGQKYAVDRAELVGGAIILKCE